MTTVATPVPRGAAAIRRLPPAWPLYVLFAALPFWWVVGAAYFIWPLVTFPLLLFFLVRGNIRFPPGFGLWLLFLVWTPLAAIQLHRGLSFALFGYRTSLYLSATFLFLYVLNVSRERLPDRTVIRTMALFWVAVIVGGFLGVFMPKVSFGTLVGALVPASFLHDQTAYNFVHPSFSEVTNILGYPVGRPKVLFAYTNQWGAAAAVLTPFALAAFARMRPGATRRGLGLLLGLSIVPIVFSLNRGLWLSLGAGLGYVGIRLAGQKRIRTLGVGILVLIAIALVVDLTHLGALLHDRLTTETASTHTRLSVYEGTIHAVKESPLIGYGVPGGAEQAGTFSNLGTHGQLFTLLYSYGVPAVVFFFAWFLYTFLRSSRKGSQERLWANACIFILLIESAYYNFMPVALHVGMVAAALAWRDVLYPATEGVRAYRATGP